MDVSWVTAFLDLPAPAYDVGVRFWAGVTGCAPSPARGDHGEFSTLLPADGDAFLRTQRLGTGEPRVHLDLHVDDPLEAAMLAVQLGAREIARPGYVVLASPGGLPLCLVHAAGVPLQRPVAPAWPGGSTSLVDQVCLDLPPAAYDAELAFWAGLTGWRHTRSDLAEFERLTPDPALPLKLLLQRLDDEQPEVAAHLDLACSDREAETERHLDLGATLVRRHDQWTVLQDPTGSAYCLTDRAPHGGPA